MLKVFALLDLPGSERIVGVLEIDADGTRLAQHQFTMLVAMVLGLGMGLGVYAVVILIAVLAIRSLRSRERRRIETRARELTRVVIQALDMGNHEIPGHAPRVAQISVAIARQLGFQPNELAEIETGALLHDIGKFGVSDAVLSKRGHLTEREWAELYRHPELGYSLLEGFPSLNNAALLVRAHHERFDGGGYPHGLAGDAIPLQARIFAVADAFDAIASEGPGRATRSHEEALAEIRSAAGSHFDPEVVRAFFRIPDIHAFPENWSSSPNQHHAA